MTLKLVLLTMCVLMLAAVPTATADSGEEVACGDLRDGVVVWANCQGGNAVNDVCKTIFGPAACDSDS